MTVDREVRARAQEIRASLPGQLRHERLSTAALLYGRLSSLDELHARIARSLPWKLGAIRRTRVEPIEQAEIPIPDEVLVTYADTLQLGLFSRFLIARPAYYFTPQTGVWLVAEVADTERWAVIARWNQ